MSPRIRKTAIKDYRPILKIEARDSLTDLAEELGFIVTRKGTYDGLPSVPDMLDALAAVYRADPSAVLAALAGLLAPDTTAPPAE
jgi:hypothetical protein